MKKKPRIRYAIIEVSEVGKVFVLGAPCVQKWFVGDCKVLEVSIGRSQVFSYADEG